MSLTQLSTKKTNEPRSVEEVNKGCLPKGFKVKVKRHQVTNMIFLEQIKARKAIEKETGSSDAEKRSTEHSECSNEKSA